MIKRVTHPAKGILGGVVLCQFISALSAVGIPPFFSILVTRSFYPPDSGTRPLFAGILYIIPSLFSALSSPFWGRLSDRYGKKKLLIRAQLGLAVSFLLASYCTSIQTFFVALALQGVLGGTFAASRAYLAEHLRLDELATGLNWIESAPRAALMIAPILVGAWIEFNTPILIYRYLAILPLLSAAFALSLPAHSKADKTPSNHEDHHIQNPDLELSLTLILALQFVFGLGSTLNSPYFTDAIHHRFSSLSQSQIGLIFGLPHLIYLFSSTPLNLVTKKYNDTDYLAGSFILQGIALMGQATTHTLGPLIFWRILMGISMTLTFTSLHGIISANTRPSQAGSLFGWLDGAVKMSSVIGGLLASGVFYYWGSNSLFMVSSLFFVSAALFLKFKVRLDSKEETA